MHQHVIPAQAGIQFRNIVKTHAVVADVHTWVPAFAGTTVFRLEV